MARQAASDNIIQRRKDVLCMPDNKGMNIDMYS
jgi:hypothetical protein